MWFISWHSLSQIEGKIYSYFFSTMVFLQIATIINNDYDGHEFCIQK